MKTNLQLNFKRNIIVFLLLIFSAYGLSAQVTYNGNGNTGFGGVLGNGNFSISDDGTEVTITFTKGPDNFNDALVIYIDSESGGFSSTANFTDSGDELRRAISGFDGGTRSTVNFPEGFEADHAIAAKPNNFGGLWSLVNNGSHVFTASVDLNPNNTNSNATYTMKFDFSEINSSAGSNSFKFVATYLNPNSNLFRSDEAIGDGISSGNPGATDITFTTYFEYSSGDEGGLATTAQAGDWSDASTWTNGNVPLAGDAVEINHDVTLNQDATVTSATISSGNTLTSEASQGRSLTIEDGGSFTNNGTFTDNDGTVSFSGGATISGTTTFNNVDIAGGVNFGTASTISGTLTVNAGGFANTNAPIYGNSSTLVFATSGSYTIDNNTTLWTTGSTLGQGVPKNVQVSTTNPLNIFEARDVTGNLTIDSDVEVVQGNNLFTIQGNFENSGTYSFVSDGAQRLIVEGNFINKNAASFDLSNAVGGDLEVLGDFTDNGSFTANGRAVFFTGSNPQKVTSATDPLTIDFLIIDKSSIKVEMLQNLDLPNDLELTNGNLDLNGKTLTISGDIRPNDGNGTIEGSTAGSTLIFDNQSTARTLESGDLASNTIANLTLDETAGVSVNTDLTVTGTFDINAGDNSMSSSSVLDINNATLDVATGASLTFESDTSGSAQLADATGTTINGDVTAERFIPVAAEDTRAFRMLTSAVDSNDPIRANWQEGVNNTSTSFANNQNPNPGFGTHITGSSSGANGFDATPTGNPSMFEFDNTYTVAADAWSDINDTDNTNLDAGKAYRLFIRGDRNYDLSSEPADSPNSDVKLRATGSLAVGSQTFSLNPNQDLYSFVGNPYQAIVNMNTVMSNTNTSNVNTNFYWVWDPNMSQRGAYVAVDLSSGALSNPNSIDVSSSEANEFVMPGQSFFVQTLSNGAADLEFTEATKDVSQNPTQVFSDNEITSINLRLYKTADFNNGEMESDALGINFSTDASNAVDQFDAAKFFNPDENLARSQNGELLSIEKRNMPAVNESLALFTNGYTVDNYTFVITLSNLSTDATAYLVDAYTGDQILLSDGENQISFSVDQNIPGSIVTDRFSITFDVDTFGVDDQQLTNDFKVYPNPVDNAEVNIQIPNIKGEAKISLYNMVGQRVMTSSSTFNNGTTSLNIGEQASGVYFLEVNQANENLKKQIIIK